MSTYFPKPGELPRNWFLVDAEGKTLGRLATEIARVLMGKHKPAYAPNVQMGDFVVVVNAGKIRLTGKKWTDKMYRHHSMYPGGLKEIAARDLMAKQPERLVEIAVKGMLPKNRIGDRLIRHMKVYAGDKHPHTAQKPATFPVAFR